MSICYSGGSKGADTLFGMLAYNAGHEVIHWSFQNHHVVDERFRKELNYPLLLEADSYLKKVNEVLRRKFPTRNEYVNNLLRRNYYQVKWSERIYASVTFQDGIPQGGTAWALYMGRDVGIKEFYVFDHTNDQWVTYKPVLGWHKIDYESIPRPHGKYAGIGASALPDNGHRAIEGLYEKTNSEV